MNTDAELLRRYAEDRSEAAFTELVQRHLGLVYSCALRRVGHDAHLAEDVTQQVFCALARKAPALLHRPSLSGWLYVGTQHAAAAVVRQERRRKVREEQATLMEQILHPTAAGPEPDWSQLRPLLDQLILELKEEDREAVILRFFEKRPFAEIAATLHLSEEAARKRADRAVEKLRARLAERGVTSGTGALAFALAGQASATLPAALAAHITSAALASAGAGGGLLASLAGIFLSDAAAVVAAVLAAAGLITWQHDSTATLRAELAGRKNLGREIAALQQDNQRLARHTAEAGDLRRHLAEAPAPHATVAPTPVPPAAESVTVVVTAQGTLRWNQERVTLADFTQRLTALQQQHPDQAARVIVHGNPGAGFGAVSYAVEQASRAGIQNIAIESQAAPAPGDNWITPVATIPGLKDVAPPSIPDPAVNP
jgi:RNA polymerase sigma factor (sigma-70 family)